MRFLLLPSLLAALASAQDLPVRWEELTAPDFVKAIVRAQATCLLPFGIVEKHGPHLPLGTDLMNVRYAAEHGAEQEYAVVFPPYFFGQIFEARHEPGTIAYSAKLQLEMLQETTDEMSRNGCKKILIVNGHGGNNSLLPFFAQSQMASQHDFVVYVINESNRNLTGRPPLKTKMDAHAGESETAHTMVSRPDLVHLDRASGVYTGIWWYAKFPEHYAGDGSAATKELGQFDMDAWAKSIANAIRAVKADQNAPRLQKEFFDKARHPLETKQ